MMLCFSVLLALIFSVPVPAAEATRLYKPASATAKAGEPGSVAGYALYLSPQDAGTPGMRGLKVRVRSASKQASGELLLTVSARSADRKSVSTRQTRFALAKGQRDKALSFSIEGPACGPVDVVAALFEGGEPLARATRRLTLPCE